LVEEDDGSRKAAKYQFDIGDLWPRRMMDDGKLVKYRF